MALYDTAVIVDMRNGEVGLWAWDLTGEGHTATERRCRAWREALDRGLRSPPAIRSSSLGPSTSQFDRATLSRDGWPRAGLHRGRRRLPGQPLPTIHGLGTSGAAGPLLAAESREPRAVRRVPPMGRLGRRLGQPRVVLSNAGRHDCHATDQGNAPSRSGSRRRRAGSPPS